MRSLASYLQKQTKAVEVSADVRTIALFFYSIVTLGLVMVLWHVGATREAATPLLWALGTLVFGAAIGFLFGIPKIVQGNRQTGPNDEGAQTEAYRQQVNTNLTEISDWLTKIIVGLSLINLRTLPPYVVNAADVLAFSVNPNDVKVERSFALGILVCFSVLGFLFGYLSTRLFLAGAFWRADTESILTTQAQLSVQVASLQSSQNLLKVLSPAAKPESWTSPATEPGPFDEHLIQMANAYMAISAPDWGERVRLKDQAANEMGKYVISMGISRDLLVQEVLEHPNEGLIIALATVINYLPSQGDCSRLLSVAEKAARKHVQYRIVLAFGNLFRQQLIAPSERDSVKGVLSLYAKDADSSLSRLITDTMSYMRA